MPRSGCNHGGIITFGSLYLWNVDSGPEELQVLPHLLRLEFGVEDGQLCKHAHVCTLQAQRRLQHGDQLLKVTAVLNTHTHTQAGVSFANRYNTQSQCTGLWLGLQQAAALNTKAIKSWLALGRVLVENSFTRMGILKKVLGTRIIMSQKVFNLWAFER